MSTTENQKLAQELDKATKLKTYLVSDHPAVEALVEKYLAVIKEERKATRSHDDKYREQLRILICNFIWINSKKNQWLYQGRGKAAYKQTRYFSGLTKPIFVEGILDTLVSLNLLEQHIGFRSITKSRVTRIRAIGSLKRDVNKISCHAITVSSSRETLWVQETIKSWFDKRTGKTKKIKEKREYSDSVETRKMRNNLNIINQKLHETFIGLWIKDREHTKLNKRLNQSEKYELNFNDKYLDRIFNDVNFSLGGRFYHGWWQDVPKVYRPYITINHQAVVELDYKHLHPAILYGMENLKELWRGFDAYTLDIEGFNAEHRDALKLLFQCLINNDSEKEALNSIRSKGLASSFPFSPKELLQEMIKKHIPIKEYFFNKEMGKQLQRIDSDIAEYCMLEMINKYDSLILPVHDSFIVQQDKIHILKDVMIEAYNKLVGGKVPIDEKGFKLWHPNEGLIHDDVYLYKKYEDQSLQFLSRFNKDINGPFMAPDVFPDSYEDDDHYLVEF
tara:strand:- start:2929 stop:4443 length:1515 start_codon:yes stop_codon:yes gene_type:complete